MVEDKGFTWTYKNDFPQCMWTLAYQTLLLTINVCIIYKNIWMQGSSIYMPIYLQYSTITMIENVIKLLKLK